jgi:hypothetical protein
MDQTDLIARWQQHLNACFADWGVPDDLVYRLGAPGAEPTPSLGGDWAIFYTVWLHHQGHITRDERRALLGAIQAVRRRG